VTVERRARSSKSDAVDLLAKTAERVAYLHKDRVAEVGPFLDSIRSVAEGRFGNSIPRSSHDARLRRATGRLDELTPRSNAKCSHKSTGDAPTTPLPPSS
jgi:hypothetical protein